MPPASKSQAEHDTETFVPLTTLAYRTGLSTSWLRAEAEAGRIPSLKVGRRLMFNIATVEAALLERANGNTECEVVSA